MVAAECWSAGLRPGVGRTFAQSSRVGPAFRQSGPGVVELVVRPTGLIDPKVCAPCSPRRVRWTARAARIFMFGSRDVWFVVGLRSRSTCMAGATCRSRDSWPSGPSATARCRRLRRNWWRAAPTACRARCPPPGPGGWRWQPCRRSWRPCSPCPACRAPTLWWSADCCCSASPSLCCPRCTHT